MLVDKETGQITRHDVFAAGDNTDQSQLVVVAIAEACKVVAAVHEYISG